MNTVDKIMALADEYANSGAPHDHRQREYEALRAAIVEALDMGEPVALTTQEMRSMLANMRIAKKKP